MSFDEAFAYWDRAITEMKAAVHTTVGEDGGANGPPAPNGARTPVAAEAERMRAEITAEVYVTLARGLLPMAADAMAGIRNGATEQRNILLGELARLHQLERAGRLVAAQEERQAEAVQAEAFEAFRLSLANQRLEAR